MYHRQAQGNSWNIFARELQNVLRKHNLSISQLDTRVGIDREKVRRLTLSLQTPGSFPVLNVDEMELLSNTLNLPASDLIRLQAAILTTSIEQTLMERIKPHDALLAANQLFPTIFQALEEENEDVQDLGNTRGTDYSVGDDSSIDDAFLSVTSFIDEGDRNLQMSSAISNLERKKRLAQSARVAYEEALQQLNQLSRDLKSLPIWKDLQRSAQQGKLTVDKH